MIVAKIRVPRENKLYKRDWGFGNHRVSNEYQANGGDWDQEDDPSDRSRHEKEHWHVLQARWSRD